jgi:protein-tyrosine phosphatase
MIEKLAVLCAGNICRSPMAFGLLGARPELAGLELSSAGLMAEVGAPPAPEAIRLLASRGIDIRNHRARQATVELLRNQDLILVMEHWQRAWIGGRWPSLIGRVFLVGHWGGYEIADPYGRSLEGYEHALEGIEQGIREWVPRLMKSGSPARSRREEGPKAD